MNSENKNESGTNDITKNTEIKSVKNECENTGKIWKRNCPKCDKELYYSSKGHLDYATNISSHCRYCKEYKKNTLFYRKCPKCGNFIYYNTENTLQKSYKKNSLCRPCSKTGELSPVLGTKQSEEVKQRKNKKLRGQKRSVESIRKYSLSKIGKNNPQFGIHNLKSVEHKRKIRLSCIKKLQEKLQFNNKLISPAFNLDACKLIDEYGKKNGYNFQHALNGGEYHIKKLGYWLDGYDKEKNVVIEYNENNHWHRKNTKKDENRRLEIIDFLKCRFILVVEKPGNTHVISEYLYKPERWNNSCVG
jgi:hypothetical protein